jgi:hypothetical protein
MQVDNATTGVSPEDEHTDLMTLVFLELKLLELLPTLSDKSSVDKRHYV